MKNTPDNPGRRQALKTLGAAGALGTGSLLLGGCQRASDGTTTNALTFTEIPHALDDRHHVPEGYEAQVLLRWGDALSADMPEWQPLKMDAAEQAKRFGYNNDFIAFLPLPYDQKNDTKIATHRSDRGLLCVNHEYTQPHLMFPGYNTEEKATRGVSAEHVDIEMAACGHTIVEVRFDNGHWQTIEDSTFNRRITVNTPMQIVGPAAGSPRMQTSADPSGTRVLGTLGNCAGGKTPWGTVLIAEEGFAGAFQGDPDNVADAREAHNHQSFGVANDNRNWGDYHDRFDVEKEPNEPNRFGWMVELDPLDPASTPRKLTNLGRFEHEGFTLVTKAGQPLVAYGGDDDEHQFVYRFVSRQPYWPEAGRANRQLLTDGTLYAARLNEDGSGEWLPLLFGRGPLTPANGFQSQADVLIDARHAATLLGATPLDRPEDVETNPHNDCTYVMLTKNKKREKTDAANPRPANVAGHILELVPPGQQGNRDHVSDTFRWNLFLLGGNPNAEDPRERGAYGEASPGAVSPHGWFANPDNVAFDPRGNMWVATDGCERFGFHDGLWAMATDGAQRAIPRHFFGCPVGAEVCGPEFTPDGTTLFVAVQHPAEDSTFENPQHRWPDRNPALPPRPAVLAIRRKDGGVVGS